MTARVLPPAEVVAGLFGQLARVVGVEVTPSPSAPPPVPPVAAQLAHLLETPWESYRSARSRSALTESGAPLELSVKWTPGACSAVRFVVDVADHRLGWEGNRAAYLRAAARVTGADPGVLDRLLRAHLWDAPATDAPTMMHGAGVSSSGERRGSLYFPASWLSREQLLRRLPDGRARLPGAAAVVAYDFAGGQLAAWKTYHWLPVVPGRPLEEHPDLAHPVPVAALVHDRLAGAVPAAARDRAAFLQHKVTRSDVADSVYFFARPWGFATPEGAAGLLGVLGREAGVPLGVVGDCLAAGRACGVPLHVGLVAIGGSGEPTVSLYLWPRGDQGVTGG